MRPGSRDRADRDDCSLQVSESRSSHTTPLPRHPRTVVRQPHGALVLYRSGQWLTWLEAHDPDLRAMWSARLSRSVIDLCLHPDGTPWVLDPTGVSALGDEGAHLARVAARVPEGMHVSALAWVDDRDLRLPSRCPKPAAPSDRSAREHERKRLLEPRASRTRRGGVQQLPNIDIMARCTEDMVVDLSDPRRVRRRGPHVLQRHARDRDRLRICARANGRRVAVHDEVRPAPDYGVARRRGVPRRLSGL